MKRQISSLTRRLISAGCLGLLWTAPLLAQEARNCRIIVTGQGVLTCAKISRKQGTVQVSRPPQIPSAKPTILTEEQLTTRSESWANLQFNEGSLARTLQNTTFTFSAGETFATITEGTALIALIPGSKSRPGTKTPNARIRSRGTVYILRYDADKAETSIRVLGGRVAVSNSKGEQSVEVSAGQLISVEQETVGSPQNFDLQAFYTQKTAESELAEGFGPGQEDMVQQEPPTVQDALSLLRTETLAAVVAQIRTFPGRGFSGSFLSNALNGTSDPLTGTGGVDTQISPRLVDPELDSRLGRTAPATLEVTAFVNEMPTTFTVTGQLSANGYFVFSLPGVQIPPGLNVSNIRDLPSAFQVGTTTFVVNSPITATGNFVDAVLNNQAIQQAVLERTGIDLSGLSREQALQFIQSVIVTPQGIPIPAPSGSGPLTPTDSGIILLGPIPDR